MAADLADLHRELAAINVENQRLKRALRDWQAIHAAPASPPPEQPHPNSGRW